MEKRDRQELIFNLITEIDDLKHLSIKIYVTFIDFADAFGSVSHEFIFDGLEKFNIPETYCTLTLFRIRVGPKRPPPLPVFPL